MTDGPSHHDLHALEHELRSEIHQLRRERYESEATLRHEGWESQSRLRRDLFRQEQWLTTIALIIWSVALAALIVALEARAG